MIKKKEKKEIHYYKSNRLDFKKKNSCTIEI